MKITEKGTYQLTDDVGVRFNTTTVRTLVKGIIFEVTQIDNEYGKWFSKTFGDWQSQSKEIPAVMIKGA